MKICFISLGVFFSGFENFGFFFGGVVSDDGANVSGGFSGSLLLIGSGGESGQIASLLGAVLAEVSALLAAEAGPGGHKAGLLFRGQGVDVHSIRVFLGRQVASGGGGECPEVTGTRES